MLLETGKLGSNLINLQPTLSNYLKLSYDRRIKVARVSYNFL